MIAISAALDAALTLAQAAAVLFLVAAAVGAWLAWRGASR